MREGSNRTDSACTCLQCGTCNESRWNGSINMERGYNGDIVSS